MLRVDRLGRRFGSHWVLRNVAFELGAGDVLAVRGSNGSGKSTLLRMLAGLMAPSEGTIQRPPGDLRRTVGYAALDLALYPHLTALEHLRWAARLRGVPDRADELLERIGLTDARDREAGRFSTGMRARLKLALAVQADPPVLLLDEPTASLDEAGRALVAAIVADHLARGPIVLATNDPDDLAFATHELRLAG